MVDQRMAHFARRIGAAIVDIFITFLIGIVIGIFLCRLFGFRKYYDVYEQDIHRFEEQYNVVFDVSAEEFDSYSEEDIEKYHIAYDALANEETASSHYTNLVKTVVFGFAMGVFFGFVITDFCIPLLLKNGRTLGKKLFYLCVVSEDGNPVTALKLLNRAVIGKYVVETMLPAYIIIMVAFQVFNAAVCLILGIALLIFQIVLFFGKKPRLLHDIFAKTLAVDFPLPKPEDEF